MNEFIKQGEYIIVNVPYMEAYIREDLFEKPEDADKGSALAVTYGEGFRLVGVFNVRIFKNPEQDRYGIKLRTFSYPNMIETYPSDSQVVKMSLDGKSEPEKFRILKYYKGDTMMESRIKRDSLNCENYLGMICKGKIPTSIPYPDLIKLWNKNFEINETSAGVPSVTKEAMIATLCRDKTNPVVPYRVIAGKNPNYNTTGYFAANMRQVTSFTNVMSALTFENMGEMLTSSINMCRNGTKQADSPFEDILRM